MLLTFCEKYIYIGTHIHSINASPFCFPSAVKKICFFSLSCWVWGNLPIPFWPILYKENAGTYTVGWCLSTRSSDGPFADE